MNIIGYKGTRYDAEQLNKYKMRFKVLYTKKGVKSDTAFAYTKTLAQAKKASKIANRGLSRVMWGKDLDSIGAKIPNSILRLIRKSPNLEKLNYNKVRMFTQKDETSVEIENSVTKIESYAGIAERMGYKKVASSLNRQLKKIADEKHEI